jgi:hypothetical protein
MTLDRRLTGRARSQSLTLSNSRRRRGAADQRHEDAGGKHGVHPEVDRRGREPLLLRMELAQRT